VLLFFLGENEKAAAFFAGSGIIEIGKIWQSATISLVLGIPLQGSTGHDASIAGPVNAQSLWANTFAKARQSNVTDSLRILFTALESQPVGPFPAHRFLLGQANLFSATWTLCPQCLVITHDFSHKLTDSYILSVRKL